MADSTNRRQIQIPSPQLGGTWQSASLDPNLKTGPVGDAAGLRLRADAAGSFRLASRDGSLGRLTLPRGVALDPRLRVYLLDFTRGVVLRHDPSDPRYDPAHPFVVLPGVGNALDGWAAPDDPRWVTAATGVATDRHSLYLADGGGRKVQVYELEGLTLRDVWTFDEADGPRDVHAHHGIVDVLTAEAVYRWQPGEVQPRRRIVYSVDPPATRLVSDLAGRLYLLSGPQLQVFDALKPAPPLATIFDAGEVRDLFRFPAVYTIPDECPTRPLWFVMPEPLTRACARTWPQPVPNRPDESNFTRLPFPAKPNLKAAGGFVFGANGDWIDPTALRPPGTPLYQRGTGPDGVWISGPLNSRLFRCRWDVVELEFADLPAGSSACVQTYTSDEETSAKEIGTLPDEAWSDPRRVPGVNGDPAADPSSTTDFLVDSPPGRLLWLRVILRGDGYVTPILARATVRFPRRSYLEHLPAVYSEDEASRRFLEQFLAVFQKDWDVLEARISAAAGLFDPASAKPDQMLDYLASWFGVRLETGWSDAARRRLLGRLPRILFAPRRDDGQPGGSRRGTPGALRDYLAAILPAIAGNDGIDPGGFPIIIEGFRERDYRTLAPVTAEEPWAGPLPTRDDSGPVVAADESGPTLWGPDSVGRFQLGRTSRLGGARLIPGDCPDLDQFAAHAHRFRVVVPATWVPTQAAASALRRAIESEKPAHTAYELDLIGPAFRIGVQSTVGVDTIVAGPAPLRLTARAAPPAGPAALAVLGPGPAPPGPVRLRPKDRLGIDAVRL